MINSLYINFAFRRSLVNPEVGTIFCRITVNKERIVVSTVSRRQIPLEHWLQSEQRVSKKSTYAKAINSSLEMYERKLTDIYNQYDSFNRKISALNLKRQFLGGGSHDQLTIKQLVDKFLEERAATGASKGTVETYEFKFRPLFVFLESEGKQFSPADDFTPGTLKRYRTWLITQRGNKPRTADKTCQTVKTLFIWASENEYMQSNPLLNTRIRVDKTPNLTYLTRDEVRALEQATFVKPHQKAVDCYLFSCYSGIAYQDMKNLTPESVQVIEGRECLVGNRQKTGTQYVVPITKPLADLIAKYKGPCMPLPTIQSYNYFIKQAMLTVGVTKTISSHTARKTFADWCLNYLKMSKSATIVAMGQKSERELDPYANVRAVRLMAEFPQGL